MQPMTEETGRALIAALQDLTTAIKSGVPVSLPPAGYDGAYVANSIVGGIEGIKAENKRNRMKRAKR